MAVLLYDGSCGVCSAAVRFLLRRERRHTLRFAPLQGRFAAGLRARHPWLEDVDSLLWHEPAESGRPERVLAYSDAALEALRYLGGPWAVLGRVLCGVPRTWRDGLYRWFARRRHRGKKPLDRCLVPTETGTDRFLQD